VYETEETISKAGLNASSAKIFPKGTLCIALYGATVGKLAILGLDAATNQAVCGIFLPEFVDTRFAYRFLESRRRELVELGKGGAQSNISQEIIRDLEFPIPPIEEQREIVAEIETQFTRLEAGVAGLRRVQANLKRYRAAVLKAACEGKLVPTEAYLRQAECGRQAELARQEGRALPAPRPGVFYVYAIRCDNDRIYIGQNPGSSETVAGTLSWSSGRLDMPTQARVDSSLRRIFVERRSRRTRKMAKDGVWPKMDQARDCGGAGAAGRLRNRCPTSRTHPYGTAPEMEWKGDVQRACETRNE
jgi:hypothetical protein